MELPWMPRLVEAEPTPCGARGKTGGIRNTHDMLLAYVVKCYIGGRVYVCKTEPS